MGGSGWQHWVHTRKKRKNNRRNKVSRIVDSCCMLVVGGPLIESLGLGARAAPSHGVEPREPRRESRLGGRGEPSKRNVLTTCPFALLVCRSPFCTAYRSPHRSSTLLEVSSLCYQMLKIVKKTLIKKLIVKFR